MMLALFGLLPLLGRAVAQLDISTLLEQRSVGSGLISTFVAQQNGNQTVPPDDPYGLGSVITPFDAETCVWSHLCSFFPPGTIIEDPPAKYASRGEKAYCFAQQKSHFDKSQTDQFCQRYFVNTQHYRPGGPVFIFDGGEGQVDGFIESSVPLQWAKTFGGIYITLEHRYYGWSYPVTDLTTDNMRWLNNQEALEDSANFIRTWKPTAAQMQNGTAIPDLDPSKTKWIYYGGSYPGGRAAHMRVLYPDIVWAAISSSGVTKAVANYWQYFNAVRDSLDQTCINAIVGALQLIDQILDKNPGATMLLLSRFGLPGLTPYEFAEKLAGPMWGQQYYAPGKASELVDKLCPALLAPRAKTKGKPEIVAGLRLTDVVANWADYIQADVTATCKSKDIVGCYGDRQSGYADSTIVGAGPWRSWLWQQCNQWGYFQTGAPVGQRSIVSRHLTYEQQHLSCAWAFPPGNVYKVPAEPLVDDVNKLGGRQIHAPRLAFIGGSWDPWRQVTPLADDNVPKPPNTTDTPTFIIPQRAHCADWTLPNSGAGWENNVLAAWLKAA